LCYPYNGDGNSFSSSSRDTGSFASNLGTNSLGTLDSSANASSLSFSHSDSSNAHLVNIQNHEGAESDSSGEATYSVGADNSFNVQDPNTDTSQHGQAVRSAQLIQHLQLQQLQQIQKIQHVQLQQVLQQHETQLRCFHLQSQNQLDNDSLFMQKLQDIFKQQQVVQQVCQWVLEQQVKHSQALTLALGGASTTSQVHDSTRCFNSNGGVFPNNNISNHMNLPNNMNFSNLPNISGASLNNLSITPSLNSINNLQDVKFMFNSQFQ
jgi:hypothetical protein